MCLEVGVQIPLLSEPFVAERAGIRFFPCVQPHVRDQVALLGEPLLADLTGIRAMGLEVVFEGILCLELDLAHSAVEIASSSSLLDTASTALVWRSVIG